MRKKNEHIVEGDFELTPSQQYGSLSGLWKIQEKTRTQFSKYMSAIN
jgi:hypothetical protein